VARLPILRACRGGTRLREVRPGPAQSLTLVVETMSETLKNRIALVTGGGRGIGQAISFGLAEQGARVAVLARSPGQVHETAGRITERGGDALALPADVADPDQVTTALAAIRQRWGPVQVLINNAAVVWPLGPSPEIDAQQWAAAIAINVTAAARLSFMALPGMLEGSWGRIVNVSSGIAANPAGMLRANAYATSKAALEAHTVNLAAERAGTGITVNVYARRSRHRDAGLDPRPEPRTDRRRPARAVRAQLPAGHAPDP
jgi:NAD(P)-dependent dehydrogenase (short-subunit alcohol dehydrogenase family)